MSNLKIIIQKNWQFNITTYTLQEEEQLLCFVATYIFMETAFFNTIMLKMAGGGLLSIESKLYVYDTLTIAHNTATRNGGGAYLSNSELLCLRSKTVILINKNNAG